MTLISRAAVAIRSQIVVVTVALLCIAISDARVRSIAVAVDERTGGTRGRYGTPNPALLGVAGGRAGAPRRARLRQGAAQPVYLAATARAEASPSVRSAASPVSSATAGRLLYAECRGEQQLNLQ